MFTYATALACMPPLWQSSKTTCVCSTIENSRPYHGSCTMQSSFPTCTCTEDTVDCRVHSNIQLMQSLMTGSLVMTLNTYSGIWSTGERISKGIPPR